MMGRISGMFDGIFNGVCFCWGNGIRLGNLVVHHKHLLLVRSICQYPDLKTHFNVIWAKNNCSEG
jgi:hypothetical protein